MQPSQDWADQGARSPRTAEHDRPLGRRIRPRGRGFIRGEFNTIVPLNSAVRRVSKRAEAAVRPSTRSLLCLLRLTKTGGWRR
jgi:hypothetical protein